MTMGVKPKGFKFSPPKPWTREQKDAFLLKAGPAGPDRITPALCRHCRKVTSDAPSWLKILSVMAPGIKRPEPQLTVQAIAHLTKRSRSLTVYQVDAALKAGLLELVPDISGTRVYRRTWYGRQILGRWKTAGWRP